MPGWKGWEENTLHALKAPVAAKNIHWLNLLHQCVVSGGKNNPLGSTWPVRHSSDYNGGPTQNYPSPRAAVAAYVAELEQPAPTLGEPRPFGTLLSIIRSADPFELPIGFQDYGTELTKWGADEERFAGLLGIVQSPVPTPTPGVQPDKGVASAWRNLLRFYSRDVPKAHGQATKLAASYQHIFK